MKGHLAAGRSNGPRSWSKSAFFCLLVACVCLSLAVRAWNRGSSSPQSSAAAVDDSLYARLLQATVCIAPQAEAFRGCGVLIDPDSKLVVTVAEVMGASENARAWPATIRSGDTQG